MKCVQNASKDIKEKLCKSLAEKIDDRFISERTDAIESLGRLGDIGISLVIEALSDEDNDVRESAVETLGKIKSDKAVEHIIMALSDENEDVRMAATETLGKIKYNGAVEHLINALGDENNHVREGAAYALGDIKSDKSIEPLIKALDDEDCNLRNSAAYILGKIKSDKAVEPLVNALADENVQWYAVRALEKIKSDKAVEPLINALADENVRWYAAHALEKIITTESKYLLKISSKSENKHVANISNNISKKIDWNDISEKEITLKKISIPEKDDPNKPDSQELPCGKPAEEGFTDTYIGGFVDRLKSIKESTSIVDYGCGQGKLLCALTTIPDVAIGNISFYAVDENTRCRYTSRLTAEKYGFFNSFKTEPEFLKPKDFYAKDIRLDYALLMHALHEIKLIDLIEIIYSISVKLKMGGQMFILDQRELIEKERSFVLWDDKKDFEDLFLDSGLEISQRFFNTGSDKKLSSIEVKKVKDDCFSREIVERNCMKVYESKKDTVSDRIDRKGISNDEHQELSIL